MNDHADTEEAIGLEPMLNTDYILVRIGRRALQVIAGLVLLLGLYALVVDPSRGGSSALSTLSFLGWVACLLGTAILAFLLLLGAELLRLFGELLETVRLLRDRS